MTLLHSITPITWLFLATLVLSVIGYSFQLDKRIIFFFAKRNKRWALNAVVRLRDEFEQKKLKDQKKLLNKYIKRARELSKASNGRRMYVVPVNDGFAIVDSKEGKRWLKRNHFNSNVTLSAVCVYYTPCTILTERN